MSCVCAKQQIYIDNISEKKKGVCSDSIGTSLPHLMAEFKSLETIPCIILNSLHGKFEAKNVADEVRCLKAM